MCAEHLLRPLYFKILDPALLMAHNQMGVGTKLLLLGDATLCHTPTNNYDNPPWLCPWFLDWNGWVGYCNKSLSFTTSYNCVFLPFTHSLWSGTVSLFVGCPCRGLSEGSVGGVALYISCRWKVGCWICLGPPFYPLVCAECVCWSDLGPGIKIT